MTERQHEMGQQVEFQFEYDPGYRLVPANGVWGGPTPRGDLRLDFFVEAPALPRRIMHALSPEGRVGPELRREPERTFTRRIQLGVLVSMTMRRALPSSFRTGSPNTGRVRGKTRHERGFYLHVC